MTNDNIPQNMIRNAVFVLVADQLTKILGALNVGGVFMPVHTPDYSLGVIAAPTFVLIAVSTVTLVAAARYGIALYESLTGPKHLMLIKAADHNDWTDRVDASWWQEAILRALGETRGRADAWRRGDSASRRGRHCSAAS